MKKQSAYKIIKKVDRVFASCRTKEQEKVAFKFMLRAFEMYEGWERYREKCQFLYFGTELHWDKGTSSLMTQRDYERVHIETVNGKKRIVSM